MNTYTNKIETVAIQKIQIHVAEAAVLLSTSSLTVYKLISTGKLAAHKEGKAWKIKVKDLVSYVETL